MNRTGACILDSLSILCFGDKFLFYLFFFYCFFKGPGLFLFWRFFLGRADPGEKIYVVLSAKVGMEYEKGRPIGKMGHTELVSYNELEAFLRLQREIAQA